jgi:peptidoglycan hydrolase-like protein with peptidoglycan-binding domain
MNDGIKKDRSPNYPKLTLAQALESSKILYEKAGKAKVALQTAVGAWGYSGLNGAALTTLGTLTAYGLLSRERGAGLSVSPLAIALIHPTDKNQERINKAESALLPSVFMKLYSDGFRDADVSIIANHLIQSGFTPDGAKVAASVYVENFKFAELGHFRSNSDMKRERGLPTVADNAGKMPPSSRGAVVFAPPARFYGGPDRVTEEYLKTLREPPVLATYSFPIGANEVTITIKGTSLAVEDFDALGEYVVFCKKQYERKLQSEKSRKALEAIAEAEELDEILPASE